MSTTVWEMKSCGKCRRCLVGRVHGPYPSYFKGTKASREHVYGEASGSAGLPEAKRRRMVADAEAEADVRWGELPPEGRELVRDILKAEVDVRALTRKRKRNVRERVKKLREEAAPLAPLEGAVSAIEEQERARYAPLVAAVRAQASADRETLSGIRRALGACDPFDEDDPFTEDFGAKEEKSSEELQRERYEGRLIREHEKSERSRLYRAIMEQGGLRTRDDLRAEYAGIPNTFKRRSGMMGDEMADHLARYHAEFGIETERDLIEFLAA